MRRRIIVLISGGLAALGCWHGGVWAADAAHAFSQANDAYTHGRYQEAADGYQSIARSGIESGVLYYNLGNALIKSGRLGEALWAYGEATRLMPRDADLRANLAYVRSQLSESEPVSVHTSRAIRWLTLGGWWSARELAVALGVLLWLVMGGWVIWGWWPRARMVTHPAALLVSVLALITGVALVVQTSSEAVPSAVIVHDGAAVKFAPQAAATTHFTLPEGAVVRVLRREAGWAQVRRGDGLSGWIEEPALKFSSRTASLEATES